MKNTVSNPFVTLRQPVRSMRQNPQRENPSFGFDLEGCDSGAGHVEGGVADPNHFWFAYDQYLFYPVENYDAVDVSLLASSTEILG